MARRGGKAASRRQRQRRAQRARQPETPQRQSTLPGTAPNADAPTEAPSPSSPGLNAFDAADAEVRASTPPPGTRATVTPPRRSVRARTSDFTMSTGSSRLSDRAAAEYHYVARDLRNISVLLVVMVVLLAASALAVNLLGIGAAS